MVLRDDHEEKWRYSAHTKVKHEILSKYIKTWSNVLGSYHDLHIFDCFAGRGRYTDGSEGSPLKILQVVEDLRESRGKPENVYCYFIEKNNANYENLCGEIATFSEGKENLDWLRINTYCDEFTTVIETIMQENDDQFTPAFFFIDPFGFGGIPLVMIREILARRMTEVFITIMTRDLNRFLASPPHQSSIQNLFGCEDVLEKITHEPYSRLTREQAILKFYRYQLHQEAEVKYTFPFKVTADENLQTIYYLIHCTNHPMGCELMKEIMYTSGTEGRFGYLGPAEGQLLLEQFFGGDRLRNFLFEKYGNGTISFKNMIYENLMVTPYIKKDYRDAVIKLEEENKVIIKGKGPRGGIRDYTEIVFRNPQRSLSEYINRQ